MGNCLSKKNSATAQSKAAPATSAAAASTTTATGEQVTADQPGTQNTSVQQETNTAAAAQDKTSASTSSNTMADIQQQSANGGKKPKILVLYYSTYGHILKMAETVVEGAKEAGAHVELYQVAETLPEAVLKAMGAPPKAEHPVFTYDLNEKLPEYDGIIFGFPTRYGMMCAQMKAFFDSTGGLWAKGALVGKMASMFTSTGTQCGGQETTILTALTQLVHHGMIFVPLGYSLGAPMFGMDEVRGGTPYGAGTYAGADGTRVPTKVELAQAHHQGKHFTQIVSKYVS